MLLADMDPQCRLPVDKLHLPEIRHSTNIPNSWSNATTQPNQLGHSQTRVIVAEVWRVKGHVALRIHPGCSAHTHNQARSTHQEIFCFCVPNEQFHEILMFTLRYLNVGWRAWKGAWPNKAIHVTGSMWSGGTREHYVISEQTWCSACLTLGLAFWSCTLLVVSTRDLWPLPRPH